MKDAFIVAETHTVHINPAGIKSFTVHTDTQKVQSTVQKAQQRAHNRTSRMHIYSHAHMQKNSLSHTLNAVRNCSFFSLAECSRD